MAISVLGSNREKTCEPELPFVKNVYIRQYLYILGLIFTGIFFKYAIEIKLEIKCKTTLFFLIDNCITYVFYVLKIQRHIMPLQ